MRRTPNVGRGSTIAAAAVVTLAMFLLLAACGSGSTSDEPAGAPSAGTCLAGDPACEDFDDTDGAGPPPLLDVQPIDEDGPVFMTFGGYFHSDGATSQLCGSLAESFPPQCGETIIIIDAPVERVLESVRESFGNPDDASVFNEGDVWWTEEFINLSGELNNGRLSMS